MKKILLQLTIVLFISIGLKAQNRQNIWMDYLDSLGKVDTCKLFDATLLGSDTFYFKQIALHPHPSHALSKFEIASNCYMVRSTQTWLNHRRKPLLQGWFEGADVYLLAKIK